MGLEGDSRNILESAQAGFTFEPSNADDLVRQIKKMSLLSPREIKNMGQSGKEYYNNFLSIKYSVDKLERILEKIIVV